MRGRRAGLAVAVVTLLAAGVGVAAGQDPPVGPQLPPPVELLPPPRPVGPPIAVAPAPGGYQIFLNRRTAELMTDALDAAGDEKKIADALRDQAKKLKEGDKPDPDAAAKLELAALLVTLQLPAFKKAMHERMGPGGVVITVTGLQSPRIQFKKPRPALEKAAGVVRGVMPLLPPDVQGTIQGLSAMARTTPLGWKVDPLP